MPFPPQQSHEEAACLQNTITLLIALVKHLLDEQYTYLQRALLEFIAYRHRYTIGVSVSDVHT